jgi:subtilisin family serine protease
MQDFSPASVLALMMANRMTTVSLISLFVAIVVAALNWDKVCYFVRRAWHGTPLIGTVARLASQVKNHNDQVHANGWRSGEVSLCEEYYSRFKSVDKDPSYFAKCEDYLSKVCEKGRRNSPFWVVPLMGALLILEAVGFAYVIGPYVNRQISANDLQYLTWSVSAFLALISGFFAHIAGHQFHHNSLIKKARHWWSSTPHTDRDSYIGKDIAQISIDNSLTDSSASGYNKILARIKTNETVTTRHNWIIIFAATIVIVAIAAFWVRTEQLNALETELVAGYQINEAASSSNSPFDLPAASAEVEKESKGKSFDDKVGAEHRASLVTFAVLSVVYVAIQFIALWLSMVFGFAGLASKEAYETTSKFRTSADMVRWMERQRMIIRGHADHKLRMLQRMVSGYDMASGEGINSSRTASSRDFDAFLKLRKEAEASEELNAHREALELRRQKASIDAHYQTASSVPTQPVASSVHEAVNQLPAEPIIQQVAAQELLATARDVTPTIKANEFDDLRDISDEELELVTDTYGLTLDQLKRIRNTQVVLAKTGKFPVQGVIA